MKRFRFLLLDANVVIKRFELGLWSRVLDKCHVLLSRTVAESEARFFVDDDDGQHAIDLTADIASHRVESVDVDLAELRRFSGRFDPTYLEKLDPGETESLAYLGSSLDPCRICSSDAIVFRVLAQLTRSDDGLSLDEVLSQIGLGRSLPPQFTKSFRERWRKQGEEERIRGIGRKPDEA
jgi:hypothetical protein